MIIQLLQEIVLLLLAFCIFFGLGFILNMLLKTTWFPIYGYIIFIIVLMYWSWGATFMDAITKSTWVDIIPLISGLVGAIASGYTIKVLRKKGFRMF